MLENLVYQDTISSTTLSTYRVSEKRRQILKNLKIHNFKLFHNHNREAQEFSSTEKKRIYVLENPVHQKQVSRSPARSVHIAVTTDWERISGHPVCTYITYYSK